MAESELYTKGIALRSALLGEEFTARLNQSTSDNPTMQTFREVTAETVFGALWTRPGLDLKTRTLICVVSDAATGRDPELTLHLRMALRQGWTEEELTEVLLHLSGYVGAPRIREALLIASQVFTDVRQESAAARTLSTASAAKAGAAKASAAKAGAAKAGASKAGASKASASKAGASKASASKASASKASASKASASKASASKASASKASASKASASKASAAKASAARKTAKT